MLPKKLTWFKTYAAGFSNNTIIRYGKSAAFLVISVFTALSVAAQCNNFTKVSAGDLYSMGIKADGTLWAWGHNSNGQLGDGTTTTRTTPVQVAPGTTWNSVSAGWRHTIAIQSDGTLWGWGFNDRGQVDGTGGTILTPKKIGFASNWDNAQISAGSDYTLMVSSGGLYAWGSNASSVGLGRLGLGNGSSTTAPTLVSTGWRTVSARTYHSLGVKTDGTLWAWGDNFYGELGIGTTGGADVLAPVQVGTATNWRSVSAGPTYSVALTTSGRLWTWGRNQQGNLGDGTTINKNAPVQIGTSSWSEISAGGGTGANFVIAKQTNNTIWSWGGGGYVLGIGSTDGNQLSPIQIGTSSDWGQIAAGGVHTLATKFSNGALWAWGLQSPYGQLGNGSLANHPSPIQIGSGGGYVNIASNTTQTGMVINAGTNQVVYNCALIASLTPNGTNPVTGYTGARVWVQSAQPAQYVKRHYEITPFTNTTTATGRVTLYFRQQEFNDFNSIPTNTLKLPTFSSDTRKANLRIEKRGGTTSNGTGLPDTYSGAVETIDPIDTDIVWNSTLSVWEVSFNVNGFSGFYVKTQETALPVSFGNINASIKNGQLLVNWQTLSETNNSHFNIQVSKDGKEFTTIKTEVSKAMDGNSTNTIDYAYIVSYTTLAQLGVAAMICLFCIGYMPRRLLWAPLLFTVLVSSLFIGCSKSATDVGTHENETLFVRVMQVDKDGVERPSKTVQVIKK